MTNDTDKIIDDTSLEQVIARVEQLFARLLSCPPVDELKNAFNWLVEQLKQAKRFNVAREKGQAADLKSSVNLLERNHALRKKVEELKAELNAATDTIREKIVEHLNEKLEFYAHIKCLEEELRKLYAVIYENNLEDYIDFKSRLDAEIGEAIKND